jgi:hypothetical protein
MSVQKEKKSTFGGPETPTFVPAVATSDAARLALEMRKKEELAAIGATKAAKETKEKGKYHRWRLAATFRANAAAVGHVKTSETKEKTPGATTVAEKTVRAAQPPQTTITGAHQPPTTTQHGLQGGIQAQVAAGGFDDVALGSNEGEEESSTAADEEFVEVDKDPTNMHSAVNGKPDGLLASGLHHLTRPKY